MITLTTTQAKVLVELLQIASDQLGYNACNDFELHEIIPDVKERREMMRDYHEYNGSTEGFLHDDACGDQFEHAYDYALMSYFADKIEGQLKEQEG